MASSNTTFNNERISAFPATDLHHFPFHRMSDTYACQSGINGTKSGLTLLLQTRDGRFFHSLPFITHQSSDHLSLCNLSYIMRPWIYNRWIHFFSSTSSFSLIRGKVMWHYVNWWDIPDVSNNRNNLISGSRCTRSMTKYFAATHFELQYIRGKSTKKKSHSITGIPCGYGKDTQHTWKACRGHTEWLKGTEKTYSITYRHGEVMWQNLMHGEDTQPTLKVWRGHTTYLKGVEKIHSIR